MATLAKRDIIAIAALIADDAVFVNGGKPLRGKSAIVESWAKLRPTSWEPQ